jgi:hypothetical protein
MKTFKPIKYEFPYEIKEAELNNKSYAFYSKGNPAFCEYLYLKESGSVYARLHITRRIAEDVRNLEEAKEVIEIYDKRKENEEV